MLMVPEPSDRQKTHVTSSVLLVIVLVALALGLGTVLTRWTQWGSFEWLEPSYSQETPASTIKHFQADSKARVRETTVPDSASPPITWRWRVIFLGLTSIFFIVCVIRIVRGYSWAGWTGTAVSLLVVLWTALYCFGPGFFRVIPHPYESGVTAISVGHPDLQGYSFGERFTEELFSPDFGLGILVLAGIAAFCWMLAIVIPNLWVEQTDS